MKGFGLVRAGALHQHLAWGLFDQKATLPRGSMYPIIRYLGSSVIVIIVQVLGEYMIIRYLDP